LIGGGIDRAVVDREDHSGLARRPNRRGILRKIEFHVGNRRNWLRIQAFYIESSAPRQASIRTIRHLPAGPRPAGCGAASSTRCDMVLAIGDTAPNFDAETTQGRIRFHDWIGDSWCVLFSHPKDFTPVCTTELGYMAKIKSEFDKRKVKI